MSIQPSGRVYLSAGTAPRSPKPSRNTIATPLSPPKSPTPPEPKKGLYSGDHLDWYATQVMLRKLDQQVEAVAVGESFGGEPHKNLYSLVAEEAQSPATRAQEAAMRAMREGSPLLPQEDLPIGQNSENVMIQPQQENLATQQEKLGAPLKPYGRVLKGRLHSSKPDGTSPYIPNARRRRLLGKKLF